MSDGRNILPGTKVDPVESCSSSRWFTSGFAGCCEVVLALAVMGSGVVVLLTGPRVWRVPLLLG